MGEDPNNLDPNNGNGGDGEDPDVDQYFDDAGDIGYLPADHVNFFFVQRLFNDTFPMLIFYLAFDVKTSKRFDKATYG